MFSGSNITPVPFSALSSVCRYLCQATYRLPFILLRVVEAVCSLEIQMIPEMLLDCFRRGVEYKPHR